MHSVMFKNKQQLLLMLNYSGSYATLI